MNRYDETLETLKTLSEVMALAEGPDAEFEVKIKRQLLEDSIEAIEAWKSFASGFSESFSISHDGVKPRIAVDLEKFLATQAMYAQEISDDDGL